MPRSCTICRHSDRTDIDKELIQCKPFRHVASRFGVSTTALQRHKRDHLPNHLVKGKKAEEITTASGLLDEIEGLRLKALRIADKAEENGDYRTALQGVRELTRIVELLAKMRGELKEQQVNVTFNSQWLDLRTRIVSALDEYPAAKSSVLLELRNAG
jgi:hypothetical protein